jgi:hypothetical protein
MSKLFSLNWKDLLKGVVVTIFTTLTTSLIDILDTLSFPTNEQWKHILVAGLAAGSAYLLKNFMTNSEGHMMSKES